MDEKQSELIIGLVCAVGTEVSQVIDRLKEQLGCAGYKVEEVKVSRDIIQSTSNITFDETNKYDRISKLMDAGNAMREGSADDAILALGVATCIRAKRENDSSNTPQSLSKTAIIVDSLKRPEEVERLRLIYPSGFVLVGVHAKQSRRQEHLINDLGIPSEKTKELIDRDGEEFKVNHGQRVNKTFHLADFFVEITNSSDRLRYDIKRMVELWFGNPYITPTFDEHAMFLAFSAALRSADLSRQVGAVIARDSQVLAMGANECPKAGGGQYWPTRQQNECIEDTPHGRDFMRTDGDSNRAEQNRMIERIVSEGKKEEFGFDPVKLDRLLKESSIRDLTEFGRVVHAEMEALSSCARNGTNTVGATLYCTTFPCHNCAKHIIVAGLNRVVYVEPYPKSKALDFHDDAITTNETSSCNNLVKFEPFVGIGPRRFFDLFSMHLSSSYPLIRKDNETGESKKWSIENAQLRIQMNPASYLDLEATACSQFPIPSNE